MFKFKYVPYNNLKEEIYQSAIRSYKTNKPVRTVSSYYKFEVTMIDSWRNFLQFRGGE